MRHIEYSNSRKYFNTCVETFYEYIAKHFEIPLAF